MRWIRWIVATVLVVALVLHTLPYLIRDQVVIWLRGQGVEDARLAAIEIGWLTGKVQIRELSAHREQHYPLELDRLQLAVDYAGLFERRVRIEQFSVEGLRGGVGIRGGELWLGPLDLTALQSGEEDSTPEPDSESGGSDWSVGLDRLQLKGIDWRLALEQQEHRLELDNLRLGGIYLWDPDIETTLDLSGRLNGAPFALDSTSMPLPERKRGELGLKIDHLPLQSLLAGVVPELNATLTTDLTLSASLEGDRITLRPKGMVRVTDASWKNDDLDLATDAVGWQGDAEIVLDALRPTRVDLNGALALGQGTRLGQSAMQLALAGLDWQGGVKLTMPEASPMQLSLDGRMDSGALQLDQAGEQPLALQLAAMAWQGQSRLSLATEQQGAKLSGRHLLDLSGLALSQGDRLKVDLGAVKLDTDLQSEAFTQWALSNTRVELDQLVVQQGEALKLAVDSVQSELGGEYDLDSARLAITAPGISVGGTQVDVARKPLAGLQGLKLDKVNLRLPLQIDLGSANISGLQLARTEAGKPLLALGSLVLNGLKMDEKALHIDSVGLNGLNTVLTLNEQMAPVDIVALQEQLAALGSTGADGEAAKDRNSEAATDAEPLRVGIGRVSVDGDSGVLFTDRSTKPVFKANLVLSRASITNIDTVGSDRSRFSLQGVVNRFAELKADGSINLLGSPRSGQWTATLTGMELPSLSPYSIKYTGYFLKSGQLSLDLSGTLDKDLLDGKNHIRLNRLEVDPVDQEKIGEFQETISMPLGTAVAVLQDGDDNIDLDLPISGSLDDPEFDYQSIINRVAGKGVKQGVMSYLLQAMQPYGALISLAQTAIDASKTGAFISLEPVAFEPGGTEPVGDASGYLDKLSQLMNERSGLRLNLCGVAVSEDRALLGEALTKENAERKEPLEPEALAAELDDRLQQLAEARSIALKERLQQGVNPERLFLCYPQIDKEGGPRVEPAL